nr:hypothetical protein [Tanacetum cinerariifolium]
MLAQHPAAATYSASADDIATYCCFLALRHTRFYEGHIIAVCLIPLRRLIRMKISIRYIGRGKVLRNPFFITEVEKNVILEFSTIVSSELFDFDVILILNSFDEGHDGFRLFSSFIKIAKGGSSLIFTLFSLPAGAELTFEAEGLLLSLARDKDYSFIMTHFRVLALNVDFDLKIDLIVFGPEIGSSPSNFFSGGRGVLQTEDSSAE